MNVYEIVNTLNQILNYADSIDGTGAVGVKALSNGQYTTREALRLELSRFLLHIGNGNDHLDEAEVALLNIVRGSNFTASQWRQIALTTDAPNPSESMTLMGFLSTDKALSAQNGYKTTSSTDALIQIYKTFGDLMVAFDENADSKARCVKYISGMKSFAMKNL